VNEGEPVLGERRRTGFPREARTRLTKNQICRKKIQKKRKKSVLPIDRFPYTGYLVIVPGKPGNFTGPRTIERKTS